jgi:asparagine synthase (glutamine-hydrolysing)
MCGIAGYISSRRGSHDRIGTALHALRHRGPDDQGVAFFRCGDAEAGLGSTRLAILDLSPAGHMPMSIAGGVRSIVLDGETGDAPSHRKVLQRRGRTSITTPKTRTQDPAGHWLIAGK